MTTRIFGHQRIERRVNILGGSTTTIISRKVISLTLIHYIERCRKKSFTKGRKQEFEILLMYYWLYDIEGDSDYWQEYLEMVLSALKKQ
jgi:hypothetical protein